MASKYDLHKYNDIVINEVSFSEFIKPKSSWVKQRKWDIPEALVIKVAPIGHFIMKEDNPDQKYTTMETREEILTGLEAGACSFHTHVRDEKGYPSLDLNLYHEVIDPIKDKYKGNVVVCGCPEGGRTVAECMAPIVEFQGVLETAPITCSCVCLTEDFTTRQSREVVTTSARIMQDVGCKPEIVLHNVGDLSLVKRWLVDTKILKKPYSFRIAIGNPGWAYVEDPFAMADCLPFIMRHLKEFDPNCAIMIDMAGRASLYIIAMGILMGAHGVRVGMEDAIYLYPHRDDMIPSNAAVVKAVVTIAEALGRRIGTADDYRRFIGL